ncbi:pentapeptide repeat-containing protein [Nodularia sp. NIES-3585]|uniref:pentapeptide repeat-containing protein n=1 Tax=Nodularia sp. NIES-3585 TaxID=1973477 RepID=UPI000B5CEA6A|nr:pentapeptide repeat-containing protein [Nodularia sp. NIES-3585]
MKLKIVFSVALLVCLGLTEQAFAVNQQDLEQLKTAGSCPRCDLSGADLTQMSLVRANLRGANLKGAILSQANLASADLTGANLEAALLDFANLTGASLTGANLKSASLTNANLSFAGLISTNLEATNFQDANLQLTNFRGAHFRLTTLANGAVTSDKPYDWSLERTTASECHKFKTANVPGTTCSSN